LPLIETLTADPHACIDKEIPDGLLAYSTVTSN
jgi:hypothetical protein